jgi:type IV secretory pathway ATPase VirB11/archaellum biosynthesis ATPase
MVELGKDVGKYKVEREGLERNLLINAIGAIYYPSVEDHEFWMEKTLEILLEVGHVTNIVFEAERNYIYDMKQTAILNQIADIYLHLLKTKNILSTKFLGKECTEHYPERVHLVRTIVLNLLKKDPIGAYVQLVRNIREQGAERDDEHAECIQQNIRILTSIKESLEQSELIKKARPFLAGHKVGDRGIYRRFFNPQIRPNFMFTRLMAEPPMKGEEVDSYEVGDEGTRISIYRLPDKVRLLYHMTPSEFRLNEDEYLLLDETRDILVKYKPKETEFIDPKRMREVFFNISRDLLTEVAKDKEIKLTYKRIQELAKILVRLTVGFGLAEVLLQDERLEDVFLNAPVGTTPLFIKHSEYGECETNIVPNIREVEAWASRFRMLSNRPLDEANPVLDTSIDVSGARSRVAIIQSPLSPQGFSIAFRRHRARPWTFPMYMKNKMISPLAAGLLSFLVFGNRTMLVAGTRGTGKTSLLASTVIEIPRNIRVITVEDTLELPGVYMRGIGYNIVQLKVRSAILGEKAEMSAEEGLRSSLRLGDSSLIIGEVRSREALALYEAMRVGALANLVAGTIHGDSPYGVFDRVVNDLGVPRTSFKATDIIVIVSKIKSPGELTPKRRVTSITEVRKHWEKDPLLEKAFIPLMEYDAKTDELKPTKDLLEGESEIIKSIAGSVREWVGEWDLVWENIQLRADSKQMLVDYATKIKNDEILESDFVVQFNDMFDRIYAELREEYGKVDSKQVLHDLEDWLKTKIREERYG